MYACLVAALCGTDSPAATVAALGIQAVRALIGLTRTNQITYEKAATGNLWEMWLMPTLYYHPRRGGKATKVAANRLAVLDTIRERAEAETPPEWIKPLLIIEALVAEIDAIKSEIELLRAELGNRPAEGAKPADVWPDRW